MACPARGETDVAIWVGIGGVATGNTNATLVQTGTMVSCLGGTAQHTAWHEVYPGQPTISWPMQVHAGDRMWAQVSFSSGVFHLTLANLTTGATSHADQRARSARRLTAEWIVEAPTVDCPGACRRASLAEFAPVRFSGARVTLGGHAGAIVGPWDRVPVRMLSGQRVAAVAGPVSKDGQSFSVTWRHR